MFNATGQTENLSIVKIPFIIGVEDNDEKIQNGKLQ
jgi:hypothetical protein